MMAKIVQGSDFKGVVNYILDKNKNAKIIASDGLLVEDKATIVLSFEAQTQMNPRVTKSVGHIALSFSKEDETRLIDRAMAGIALEYMEKMGITDTQFFIARHSDKEHPHVHIAFNRISNSGKTISDRNERYRSERICKELTKKYGLYFANSKEHVKQYRLKEPDKTKYELYSILKTEVGRCGNWNILITNLQKQGVETCFKYKGSTEEIQGVTFSKNGYHFNGSKIDRRFSYSKIDVALENNHHEERQTQFQPQAYQEEISPDIGNGGSIVSGSLGLFMPGNVPEEQQQQQPYAPYLRNKKKKRQRKINW